MRKGLQRFLFAGETLAQFAGVIVCEIEPKVEAFDEARAFVHGFRRLGEEPHISPALLRWRSALAESRKPASSSVTPSLMQASASASGRRSAT